MKGISLIEILIVCAVITLLIGISIPSANRLLPSLKLSGSARQLISDGREMQERAVTQQNRHLLRFSTSPASYQKIRINDDLSETVLSTITLENLSIQVTDLVNNEISYGSDGSPASTGSLTLSSGEKTMNISIGPSGILREER